MQKEEARNQKETHLFYIDYFGSRISCNGKSYSKNDIDSIDKIKVIPNTSLNYNTHVYKVHTKDNLEGILKIYSNTPNFKSANYFIKRCQSKTA